MQTMERSDEKTVALNVRLPEDMRRNVKVAAAREGLSVSELVRRVLREWGRANDHEV